jgi:hypothetical protein
MNCSLYFSRFRVLLFQFYFVPFSLSSSLGAGLGKLTQKPLGAHQEIILIAMKENTAFFLLQTELQTVHCFLRWKIRHHKTLTSITSFYHLRCITPIIPLLITLVKETSGI